MIKMGLDFNNPRHVATAEFVWNTIYGPRDRNRDKELYYGEYRDGGSPFWW